MDALDNLDNLDYLLELRCTLPWGDPTPWEGFERGWVTAAWVNLAG